MQSKAGKGSASEKSKAASQQGAQAYQKAASAPNITALKLQSYSIKVCHIPAYSAKKGG